MNAVQVPLAIVYAVVLANVLLPVVLWVVQGSKWLNRPTVPAPAPANHLAAAREARDQAARDDRLLQLVSQTLDRATELSERSAAAVGNAIAQSLAPPPAPPAPERQLQIAHEMAADAAESDVDDHDPVGDTIPSPDRVDHAFVSRDELDPFGVPGVNWPSDVRGLS